MVRRALFVALCFAAVVGLSHSFSLPSVPMRSEAKYSGVLSARCARTQENFQDASDRRKAIAHFGKLGSQVLAAGTLFSSEQANAAKAGPKFPEPEWEALIADGKLSKKAFRVLHDQATEKPFTSPLLLEKRAGTFACAACGTDLFASSTKFDSGTGWPSFFDKLAGVELETGNVADALVMRAEVHCDKCGGHLGHVFDDGWIWSVPTNKRYCINGLSLTFKPSATQA